MSTSKRRPPVWSPIKTFFTDKKLADLESTRKLYTSTRTAHDACIWAQPGSFPGIVKAILERIEPQPPDHLRDYFQAAIAESLSLETHIFYFPDIEFSAPLSLKEQTELRAFLRAKQRFCARADEIMGSLAQVVLDLLNPIAHNLPRQEIAAWSLSVPLNTLLRDLAELMTGMIATILADKTHDLGLCHDLYRVITTNIAIVSGIDPSKESTKQPIFPKNTKLTGDALVTAYLGGTPLADLLAIPTPFVIPRRAFNEHGAIFAKSGHGKTRALRALVANFLQEPDPPALFLIDSLGSLIEDIPDLEVFHTKLRDHLVILDPSNDKYIPSLNLFNLRSDDLVFYLFKAIDQSFTARQATMISYIMEYMRQLPKPDLLTLIQLCEAPTDPFPGVSSQLTPFAATFFQNQFFGKRADKLVAQTKQQIAQRIYTLGRIPKFPQMFSGKQTNFDPIDIMQNKKVCLINTDARPTDQGGLGEASGIFGRFILAQCLGAARTRPKDQRHLALLVVDEAKAYMDDQAALILSDARQFGLGMLLASQQPHQLPEGVRREINTNTSIRLMGNVEYSIASQYARDMFTTPEFIVGMKSYDREYAEWACYVSNMTDAAVKVTIPFTAIEEMPKHDGQSTYADSPLAPIMWQESKTPTGPPTLETPNKPDPSDIELAVTAGRNLETFLETHFGATGRGGHEKLSSVEARLPPELVHQARYIATMRNNTLHVRDFKLDDRPRLIRYMQALEDHFADLSKTAAQYTEEAPAPALSTSPGSNAAAHSTPAQPTQAHDPHKPLLKPGKEW